MKEILEQYASYNVWANQTLLKPVLAMSETQQQQTVAGSFNSLQSAFLYLWDVESAWWQRVKLQEQIIFPGAALQQPSMQEIADGLISQGRQWESWVKQSKENMLQHVFGYHISKSEYFKNPVWQTVMHVFNQSTYHRGQIVAIFHQLEIKKIPNTDFGTWCRKK